MSSKKSFHYFGNTEHQTQNLWANQRDAFFNFIFSPFKALGLTPNILTFASLVCLIPIPFIYTAQPWGVTGLLLLYTIFDSLDGSYARWSGIAGKAGSILDIANDQLGLIIICFLVIHLGISPGWLVLLYSILYILMIVFAIILNELEEPTHIIFRSKYWLYLFFIIFSFQGWDLITPLMLLTCPLMLWTCLRDYFQLWLHFREKQQRQLLSFSNKVWSSVLLFAALFPALYFYIDNHALLKEKPHSDSIQYIETAWKKLSPPQEKPNFVALTTLANQRIISLEKIADKHYKFGELLPRFDSYQVNELFQKSFPFEIEDIAINPVSRQLYILKKHHPTILSIKLNKSLKPLSPTVSKTYQIFPRKVRSLTYIGQEQLLLSFERGSTHLGIVPTPETSTSKYVAAKLLSQNRLLQPALLSDSFYAHKRLWVLNRSLFQEEMNLQLYQSVSFGDRHLKSTLQHIQLPFSSSATMALKLYQLIVLNKNNNDIWVMKQNWEKIIKQITS